jgi:Protein of unknown function (DUF1326)
MQKPALRGLTTLVLLVVIANLRGQNATGARAVQDFRLEGVAIWQCQCPAYGCPCQQNGLPTHGMCHASDFAHIKKGRYGKVSLDGLNVVMVGNLVDGKSDRLFATLYVDKAATPEQSDALTQIVEYMNDLANQPLSRSGESRLCRSPSTNRLTKLNTRLTSPRSCRRRRCSSETKRENRSSPCLQWTCGAILFTTRTIYSSSTATRRRAKAGTIQGTTPT